MSYQVIARRWRPQNFDELVHQEHVSRTIQNSIKNNRISHAYMFSGPRGVGKTTSARILAKSLNCINGPTPDPCGKCENCLEIKDSTSFDVIEIDGASNNGVDNIRELREKVNFAPIKGAYKVYIIDEVHMLTEQAFNALLKTLEEPPPHVVFIFATTEIHKVPETILSRCQKFFFKKISVELIVTHLKKIAGEEKISIDESAIYHIARSADGSMRDAQSLLEQIISFADGQVNEEAVLSILGIMPLESYIKLLFHIAFQNTEGLILEIEKVILLGVDIPRYTAGFADILRAVRLLKNKISLKNILNYSDTEITEIEKISTQFSDEELSAIFKIVNNMQNDLRFAVNEQIIIEMNMLDMIEIMKRPSLSAIIQKIEKNFSKKKILTESGELESGALVYNNIVKEEKIQNSGKNLKSEWIDLLKQLKIIKQYLFQKLKNTNIFFDEDKIFLTPEKDKYYNNFIDTNDIEYISDILTDKIGKKISIIVKQDQDSVSEKSTIVKNQVPLPDAMMQKEDNFEELEQDHPVVNKLKDMFYGEIVKKEK